MSGFEYNDIRPDAVEDVELLSDESSDYQQFKQRIYDTSDEIPEERQRMIDHPRSTVFVNIADQLVAADCEKLIEEMFLLEANIPDYVTNPDELREGLLKSGRNTDADPEYGDLTPSVRGKCKHAKDDDFRPDDDDALCCWECSPDDTRKPKKFMRSDPACESCTIAVPMKYKLKQKLAENLRVGHTGFLSDVFRDSDLSPLEIHSYLSNGIETRSRLIQLAFRVAYPDEDYYYQRAEALLRDLNADVAKDSGPGAGGRRFEYEAIEKLEERFTLRDETVFKITFDDDAPPVAWRDFVEDPSEPTYKEADAIIEGDIGPIVVDFFTQRQTREKRKQVHNYAELYEIATGEEPRAWGVTDETRGELLELDTLTGGDTPDVDEGQAGLGDFL
jgi:hypothetical protein